MVPLCKGGAARIEPAVHDKRFTVHHFTRIRDEDEIINDGTMQINIIGTLRILLTRSIGLGHFFLELCNGAHALHLTRGGTPNGQRSTPVSLTGNRPVLDVAQPFTKSAFTDPIRCPFYLVIEFQEALFHCCHSNKPGIHRIVEQRVICSPTVWILVSIFFLTIEQIGFHQNVHDGVVTFLDIAAIQFRMCTG